MDKDGHPHIAVNVIAPDHSAKRIAFGVLGSKNQATTSHAMVCIRDHVQEVARLYQFHQWTA